MSESKECKDAATKLGLHYGGTFNLNYRPAGCYFVSYKNKNYTFFNLADPSETHNIKPNAGGVCQKGISDICSKYCISTLVVTLLSHVYIIYDYIIII